MKHIAIFISPGIWFHQWRSPFTVAEQPNRWAWALTNNWRCPRWAWGYTFYPGAMCQTVRIIHRNKMQICLGPEDRLIRNFINGQ